ncbi:MAG TPA: XdhC family protein [Kofleriaceae bacterium]|nr:XdhC family protein [Kofleriaceae bacterium]
MIERDVVEAAVRLRATGEPYVIATVVEVAGSAYRRPGARMLIGRDRWIAGSVSGGCLEGDAITRGWWRTERGPVVVSYDARVTEDDDERAAFGLGCDGVVDVLFERAGAHLDPLELHARAWRAQARAKIATIIATDDPIAAPVGARVAMIGDELLRDAFPDDAFAETMLADLQGAEVSCTRQHAPARTVAIEVTAPPPCLFVLGSGHDAVPVVAAARALGWETIVLAPHARPGLRDRFAHADQLVVGPPEVVRAAIDRSARAACVIMSHDLDRDRAALAVARATGAAYIGVLGPRRRTERLAADVFDDPRVHAPVGLALGAETPAAIALSIVAEIHAFLAGAETRPLSAHAGPIHPRTVGIVR